MTIGLSLELTETAAFTDTEDKHPQQTRHPVCCNAATQRMYTVTHLMATNG